jgi:hypothetical protein
LTPRLQVALIKDINKIKSNKVNKGNIYYITFLTSAKPFIKDLITLKQALASNNIKE